MDHYEKGESVEVEGESPLEGLKDIDLTDVVTMKVKHGSKVRNIMGFAMRKIKEDSTKHIIFAGSGPAISKTITCVEIMKRKHKTLHQISKAYYKRIEEFWEPKEPEEGLDRLKVNRRIPAIMVLLSKEQLDINEPGYQAPGTYDALWVEDIQKSDTKPKNTPGKRKHKQYHDKTSNGDTKSAKGNDANKSAKGSDEQSKRKTQKRRHKNQNNDKGQRHQQKQEQKKEQE